MRVNDQLENAAIEVVDSLPSTVAVGRMLFLSTNSKMYVGNASKKPVVIGHSVGEIKTSMLTLSQFQAEFDDTWVLANGASATGTDYGTITSESTIPDLRGRFLRGKNNGRNDGNENPNGDLSLGDEHGDSTAVNGVTVQSDTHNHSLYSLLSHGGGSGGFTGTVASGAYPNADAYPTNTSDPGVWAEMTVAPSQYNISNNIHSHALNSSDAETAPAYTTVNYFIKVNR